MKYMAYHLVVTSCIGKSDRWTFSIKGPASSVEELHLNYEFRGSLQGAVDTIFGRKFYSVIAPPNAGRRLNVTLLPEKNFNAILRIFDDRGGTLVPMGNTQGAAHILSYEGVNPGRTYFICVEGNSAGQRYGIGNYQLLVELVK